MNHLSIDYILYTSDHHFVSQASATLNWTLRHLVAIFAKEKVLKAETERLRAEVKSTGIDLETKKGRHANTTLAFRAQ